MPLLRILPAVALAACVVAYWILLIGGLDFGNHWDEHSLMKAVARVPETGLVLPRWYNYPSMSFLVSLSSVATYIVWEITQHTGPVFGSAIDTTATPSVRELAKIVLTRELALIESLAQRQEKGESWMFTRAVFASLATLAVPMIWLAAEKLTDRWVALATGLVLLGSFHFFMHARWIAPDMLQVLWITALILFTLRFLETRSAWSLNATALVAGLMIATKYPAGLFLLCPLILANLDGWNPAQSAKVILLAVLCYLMITPGTFIEPRKFAYDVLYEIRHYSEMGHEVSTVPSGRAHLALLAEYFFLRVLHMNPFVSAGIWLFVSAGMVQAVTRHRHFSLAIGLPSLLYFLYLSTQQVMIVRNSLVLLPVISLCFALGVHRITAATGNYALTARIGAVLLVGVIFITSASEYAAVNATLRPQPFGAEAAASVLRFAKAHEGTVYVSDSVAGLLRSTGNVTEDQLTRPAAINRFEASAVAIFTLSETRRQGAYFGSGDWREVGLANRRNTYTVLYGPRDVDLDYYPNWKGRNRIVATGPRTGANFAYWKLLEPWEFRPQNGTTEIGQ